MATAKLKVPILLEWKDIEAYMAQHDIVEVVRCRDCKYRNGDYCHVFLDGYSAFIYDNDFCSFGERREDVDAN